MWSEIYVDAAKVTATKRPFPENLKEFGGRALVTNYLMEQIKQGKMDPKCDPLGEQNPLIICTGVFAGTNFPTGHRVSIGGKGPLTGTIKECSSGGTIARFMADQGVKLITVHGLPSDGKLRYLHLAKDGSVVLEDAEEYRGMGNYAFVKAMFDKYGKDVSVASIGPAGELLRMAASIQVTEFGSGHPSRSAARGGIGALMGAKGLKAVVIEKPDVKYQVEFADEELFKKACSEFSKVILEKRKAYPFHQIGTISTIANTARNGILPVANFSGDINVRKAAEVGVEKYVENLSQRGGCNKQSCQAGCIVQCSNVYNDKDGNYLTSGFEYETIALLGPNCLIYDLDKIAELDRLCDDVGVDTIEMGTALGVAMECGKLAWGDADAALQCIKEIPADTEFGRLLGDGCEAVGKALGSERIPVVKHQAMSGYDPRNTKGTGITYATSPQGADHTAACTMGYTTFGDTPRATALYVSNKLQVAIAFSDSMMCLFAFSLTSARLDLLLSMYVALYGGEMDITRITLGLGVKTLITERTFNQLAGFTKEDDRLPKFMLEERNLASGETFDIGDLELDTVFNF